MYKFIINSKTVYLTSNPAMSPLSVKDDVIIKPFTTKEDLNLMIKIMLSKDNSSHWVIFAKDVEQLKTDFCAYFQVLPAAGGVVLNAYNELLLIHRRGFWDLPKGKVEEDEQIDEAALRELQEETGLSNLSILQPILFAPLNNQATYHSYVLNGENCLKESFWFLMRNNGDDLLTPQTEEDIEQAVWVHKENLHNYFDNMYATIKDVIDEALKLI